MALPLILSMLAVLLVDVCYSASISKDPEQSEEVMRPKRGAFCNLFSGCGPQKLQADPGMPFQELMRQAQFVDDDTLPVVESEKIDELSRQIVPEEKLWEAIQETSARRK